MSSKRMSRKELKQPDKVLSTMERGLEVVTTHRRVLLIGSIVVVVAVGLYIFFHLRSSAKAEEGAKLFQKGLRTFTAGVDPSVSPGLKPKKGEEVQAFRTVQERAQAALVFFDQVVRDYEGYPVARSAHLYRGRCLYDLKKYGDAITAFKKVLSSKGGGCGGGGYPGSGALEALALENLGYAQVAKGRIDDARSTFAKLREMDKGNRRDWGYYHEALLLESKGDLAGAIKAYEKIKQAGQSSKGQDPNLAFAQSPLGELSTRRARYLQMKLEAKEPETPPRRVVPRPSGDDMAPAGDDMAPAGDDMAPAGDDMAPAGDDMAPAGDDMAPAGDDMAPAGDDMAPAGMAPADMAPAGMAPADMAPAGMASADMAPAGMAPADMAPADMAPADMAAPNP